ncbi:hypothetical protein EPO33_04055 [Patescibacteria group bacterium]|nr:MAG: hypothetical protein EPO33_04055 [Patescibacteria group bacterium]
MRRTLLLLAALAVLIAPVLAVPSSAAAADIWRCTSCECNCDGTPDFESGGIPDPSPFDGTDPQGTCDRFCSGADGCDRDVPREAARAVSCTNLGPAGGGAATGSCWCINDAGTCSHNAGVTEGNCRDLAAGPCRGQRVVRFEVEYDCSVCLASSGSGCTAGAGSCSEETIARCEAGAGGGLSPSAPGTGTTGDVVGPGGGRGAPAPTLPNPLGGTTDIRTIIGRVINAALGISGSIALLMFIWGGMLWLTSGGSPERIQKGKNTIVWAVLGLVLIFGSYAILNFVLGAILSA